jgi:hypothetical protein
MGACPKVWRISYFNSIPSTPSEPMARVLLKPRRQPRTTSLAQPRTQPVALARPAQRQVLQRVRFQELRKALEPIRAQLPDGLADPVTLDAVADLLRTARNEAGHPTGKPIDEGTAHTHLYIGAELLQKMTALRMHFDSQAKGAST